MKNTTFEISINNMIRENWAPNRKLVVATFEISPRCNFECIHCYLGTHRIENELNFDEIKTPIYFMIQDFFYIFQVLKNIF